MKQPATPAAFFVSTYSLWILSGYEKMYIIATEDQLGHLIQRGGMNNDQCKPIHYY